MYLIGRGKVYIGARNPLNGDILALSEFHTPELEMEITSEFGEHYNTSERVAVKDLRVVTKMDGKVRVVVDTFNPDVLQLVLGGEKVADAGTTFTDKLFPTGLVVGGVYAVPGRFANLASLVIKDSTGSPVTLTAGTHYEADLDAGLITIKSLTSVTQPLKASGVTKAGTDVGIATKGNWEKFIRFDGINIADNDAPVIVDIYRVSIPPSKLMPKSEGNEVNKFEFAGEMLRDEHAPLDPILGKYGRVRAA